MVGVSRGSAFRIEIALVVVGDSGMTANILGPMSIFVSIASYCDPVLPFTLERAVATARWPDRLHFGIVDQSPEPPKMTQPNGVNPARLTYLRLDPVFARGPCWARAVAMSLYDGEQWYFQVDSHMDFDLHWDERLTAQATALLPGRPGVVLSSYPNAFVFEQGKPVTRPATHKVLAHVVKTHTGFEPGHPVLMFEAHPLDQDEPLPAFHVGAGCFFASGHFAQQFPYDPWLYFHGEEQALAARLFTHGWDMFHVPGLPVYHLYNTPDSGAPARPMHWDTSHDTQRSQAWWTLEERARNRLAALVAGDDLGAYSLGHKRTMADYAAFSGIDYAGRTIAEKAYRPQGRLAAGA
jgi:hypothetical protein